MKRGDEAYHPRQSPTATWTHSQLVTEEDCHVDAVVTAAYSAQQMMLLLMMMVVAAVLNE